MSAADTAALEWALRCGERWDRPVTAVTVGRLDALTVLRDALACGATRAVRVDASERTPSASVAAALASVLTELGATMVWCGDCSLDRGSGSVPAYLAAELGFAQALGLVDITIGADRHIGALRRLDGGRREQLHVRDRAVLSVEGSTARLRRAPLSATLESGHASVEVRSIAVGTPHAPAVMAVRPYRPRARVRPAPRGLCAHDRIVALTEQATADSHRELLVLDPAAAADRILAALSEWGYLVGDP
jgi:electron transfer flavoprotein beta subunit